MLALAVLAQGAAPKSLAIPPWTLFDVTPEAAALYADRFAQQLREGGFRVITASEIATLLATERQRQLLGCAEDATDCLAELANALGTDATVVVRLGRLDDVYRAQLKVLRSSDGAVLAETQLEARGQNALLAQLDGAAERITRTLRPPGPRRWAWAPGALALGGLGAGIGFLVAARGKYLELEQRLHRPADAELTENTSLAATGSGFQTAGWVALAVGLTAALATLALLVFGAPRE